MKLLKKTSGWHYLYWTVGGGVQLPMLVEFEVFSGVGGGGIFFGKIKFFMWALIIS